MYEILHRYANEEIWKAAGTRPWARHFWLVAETIEVDDIAIAKHLRNTCIDCRRIT